MADQIVCSMAGFCFPDCPKRFKELDPWMCFLSMSPNLKAKALPRRAVCALAFFPTMFDLCEAVQRRVRNEVLIRTKNVDSEELVQNCIHT